MNRVFIYAVAALQMCIVGLTSAQDTIRCMTYNGLNFSGSSTDRLDELQVVMRSAMPDVLVMQEIIDQSAVNNILNQVFRPMDPDWQAANFINGPDTDNACFYLSSRVTLVSQRQISTTLRDFSEYVLTSAALGEQVFRMYSGHLKASDGADNAERRRQEAEVLRGQLDQLPDNSLFMFCGDFNLYTSFEPAYQLLLALGDNPQGRLLDPINRPGAWNNSVSFADIHTQSPRTTSFGGGATGGMDDRFDFILASAAWMDTTGSYLLPSTYKAYGNDGQHFNLAINNGTNTAVPDSVADALHDFSDHLPVLVDVVLRDETSPVTPLPPVAESPLLLHCFPNPFNSRITIDVGTSSLAGELRVFDVLGRTVSLVPIPQYGIQLHSLDFTSQASGTYFVVLRRGSEAVTNRIILQK
ncbi:MAG: T9SS type A sorting domain-containing protein [Calditrichaeota bacterium]|nr:T9SS type A sorting domain-containing protein [Calditrichota bacterium]MCB9368115.1 T9SS type A sorting domain-containing protein [Calditrichota bacterium]